ncbi:MAG TPA: hypothetical protein VM686_10300 [Polyangiaceae bacterium]|nr:hypothetical protein [Polyangiaceae bacterium]
MTIPKRHRALSAGKLQSPENHGVRLAEGLTLVGRPSVTGGTITLHLDGQSVSVVVEAGESTQSVGRKLRAALSARYEVTP